jgi:hypothetical protein
VVKIAYDFISRKRIMLANLPIGVLGMLGEKRFA